ncbi:MAG: hypothetical protein ABI920_17930 [Casimicrobiaceae bacterium]
MSDYPRKDADATTRSTLRGDPLRVLFREELLRDAAAHDKLARAYVKQYAKLLPKKDLRLMAKIAGEVLGEWREDILHRDGDSARIAKTKAAARRKLDRAVGRALPNVAKARAMRRMQLREHAKLSAGAPAAFHGAAHHVDLGDLVATLTDCAEFVPPFTSFDVGSSAGPGEYIVRDDSFVKPGIGHLVNNFDYDQNENTSFSDGLWGLLTRAFGSNWAACGVPFTTNREGRLEIHAVMRNFYNKVMFSVTDKFGFSDAEVDIFLQLFIMVVRGSKVIFMPTTLRHTGLVSHGSDLSYHESDIDNSMPLTISATTDQRLNANESVLVLAGSRVLVQTVIDDMHCKVDAVLWWQLQKLCIKTAEDVFT